MGGVIGAEVGAEFGAVRVRLAILCILDGSLETSQGVDVFHRERVPSSQSVEHRLERREEKGQKERVCVVL